MPPGRHGAGTKIKSGRRSEVSRLHIRAGLCHCDCAASFVQSQRPAQEAAREPGCGGGGGAVAVAAQPTPMHSHPGDGHPGRRVSYPEMCLRNALSPGRPP